MYCFTHKDDKKTKYLLTLDFDENDEVTPRFTPIAEHQKLTGPGLDPGDILGAVCEAERLARAKEGESFDTLNFNERLALVDQETHRTFRRLVVLKVMSLMRRRPVYRPPVSRSSQRRVRIRAPRRSHRSTAVASRGGGDDGGGGEPDPSGDPPRPRLTSVLGTVEILFPSQPRNSKAPWRRRRPGPCRMARYSLRPVPRSRHGCLSPP